MPRNNQAVPKTERQAAVLAQAIELFKENGYRATSMAAVGKAVGLAPAAVHWYYPSKDDLFAAALHRIILDTRTCLEANRRIVGDPYKELTTFLDQLAPYRSLHREAYERMEASEPLRAVYAESHEWMEVRFLAIVEEEAPEWTDRARVAEVAQLLFEGLLVSIRRVDRPAAYYIDLLKSAVIGAATANAEHRQ